MHTSPIIAGAAQIIGVARQHVGSKQENNDASKDVHESNPHDFAMLQ